MNKLYFCAELLDEENAYELDTIIETMADEHITEVIVEEAVKEYGNGIMWCKMQRDFVDDTRDVCGVHNCKDYAPCNGKNGRCRELTNTLINTGKFFNLGLDGKLRARVGNGKEPK